MLKCAFCGKTKEEIKFWIGSTPTRADQIEAAGGDTWAMQFGTGTVHCGSAECVRAAELEHAEKRGRALEEARA